MATKKLKEKLSKAELAFLVHACTAIGRLLPHVEVIEWRESSWNESRAVWKSSQRKEIAFTVGVRSAGIPEGRSLHAVIRRRKDREKSSVSETLDQREHHICRLVAAEIALIFATEHGVPNVALPAIEKAFDEHIVSRHLREHHAVDLPVSDLLGVLHTLAEETYENKALTFGCVVDPNILADGRSNFPKDFTTSKKFKALSDGYRTAYVVSGNGAVIRFADLDVYSTKEFSGAHFYPEWAEPMARASRGDKFGISLSRQGDVLVFEQGTLRFSYRYGRWQYWNHSHLVNLIKDMMHYVPIKSRGNVAGAIYRAAIDVSFRRSGGLFVILKDKKSVSEIVRNGDAIGHVGRSRQELEFDRFLENKKVHGMSRRVLVELASLDGAVVLTSRGALLAYGAVLQPKRKGRLKGTEGSRTKAAIGASHFGLAVKISSDGDITLYSDGKAYMKV
ncbi:hypothetical protein EON76_06680 [bacterium]|nr:MAG: hypothetical protein EON76_06680 [bacterium]